MGMMLWSLPPVFHLSPGTPEFSMPPNIPTRSEAPAIMGIQMRTKSAFHLRKSASSVFARLSTECSIVRLARSTCATTPPCESEAREARWRVLLRSCHGSAGSLQRIYRVGQTGTEEVLAQTLA